MTTSRTRRLAPTLTLAAFACLLQACAGAPSAPTPWPSTAPLLRISDGDGANPAYAYQLGRHYERQGDARQAEAAYRRALALALAPGPGPDLDDARTQHDAHTAHTPYDAGDAGNALAVLLARGDRLDEAAALLEQLAAGDPTRVQSLNNLAYLYHLQQRPQAALTALRAALALAPAYPQALANLALVQASLAPASGAPAMQAAPAAIAPTAVAKTAQSPTLTATTAKAPTAAAKTALAPTMAAMPALAALAPAGPAAAPAATRLELVRLSANEFRLQARAGATPTAAASVAIAADSGIDPNAIQAGDNNDDGALQIVNGNGVNGAAARARRLLQGHGVAVAAIVNQRGGRQRRTTIEYLPGQRARAEAARAVLRGPVQLVPARALPGGLGLRLVLGRDHADHADHEFAAPRLAAASLAAPLFTQE